MISRRAFIGASALAATSALARLGMAVAASGTALHLTVQIGSQTVSRQQVLQWEARRLQIVADRIKSNLAGAYLGELDALLLRSPLSTANVARDRQSLADVKMRLGEAEMRKVTSLDLLLSDPASTLAAIPNQWALSRTTITSNVGTARGFLRWFNGRIAANDVRAMLVACPDHYVLRTPGAHRQEVIEVTGGAIAASHFLINYTGEAGLPIPADPKFAVRTAGWARNSSGTRIGAVHHQFRDNPQGGFTTKAAIAFPALLPPTMISEHRWHLACEFSNWITAYAASSR